MNTVNIQSLVDVAEQLKGIGEHFAFLGGAVIGEIKASPTLLRQYLAARFAQLLANDDFTECLPGHVSPDAASQQRVPALLELIRGIAELA